MYFILRITVKLFVNYEFYLFSFFNSDFIINDIIFSSKTLVFVVVQFGVDKRLDGFPKIQLFAVEAGEREQHREKLERFRQKHGLAAFGL